MGSALSWLLWREPTTSDEEEEHDEPTIPLAPPRRYPRSLPYNVLDAAAEVVAQLGRAELASCCNTELVVCLPSKRKLAAQSFRWPLVKDPVELACAIRALMQEDGVIAIRSMPELCARYPGHFWNLVFHYRLNVDDVLEFMRQELVPQ
jgi:hypothetical protein